MKNDLDAQIHSHPMAHLAGAAVLSGNVMLAREIANHVRPQLLAYAHSTALDGLAPEYIAEYIALSALR